MGLTKHHLQTLKDRTLIGQNFCKMLKIGPFTKQDDIGNQISLLIIPFILHQWPKFLFAKEL